MAKANEKVGLESKPTVEIRDAFYIKLGKRGDWEASSLKQKLMRIGWLSTSLDDINAGNWKAIESQIRSEISDRGAATRDLKALRQIAASTEEDVWITFCNSHLNWCRLAPGPVEQDTTKFRRTMNGWHDCDIKGNKLPIADIPGILSQLQGFRATACRVRPVDLLRRLLNAEPSLAHRKVTQARATLTEEVKASLSELHWKDFEILVDLIFRNAGWRRLSILGETMKFVDLELEEPINRERYLVQVKSKADTRSFDECRAQFKSERYRKLYFVVHTPQGSLSEKSSDGVVELVLPQRLAEMVVDAGLVNWLLAKIR